MISLSADEKDALIEICNVGMCKAAKQLSSLLNSHIEISIPDIVLLDLNNIIKTGAFGESNLLAYVFQSFSNGLDGRAILIFNREHTTILTEAVMGKAPKLTEKELRACQQEAMIEIGNIIISSCMSAIVNMLSCKVNLTIPSYSEAKIKYLLESQVKEIDNPSENIIFISTDLEASGKGISGKLLLLFTYDSIEILLLNIKKLLGG